MSVTWVKTEYVPIDDLTPFPGNARRGDVEKIRESIARLGQYRSLVVRDTGKDMVILAGNHTYQALAAEGNEVARCEVIRCDDDEAKRINLADNRMAELGGYDDDALAELLSGLDGDLDGTGYAEDDLNALLAVAEPQTVSDDGRDMEPEADQVPEPPSEPVTRTGDVWLLGPHRILCGDSRDAGDVARLLDGARVNVAFTSPPYASQRAYDESSGFKPIPPDEYVGWFDDVQANVRAHLAEDGSWFVNIKEHCEGGQRHLYVKDLTAQHVRAWGWKWVDELVWLDTKNGMPGKWPNRFKDAWERVLQFSHGSQIKFRPTANATPTDDMIIYNPETRIAASDGRGGGYHEGSKPREYTSGLALPSNVVQIPAGGDGSHTAAFPVALPAWFIRAYSDPGDVVFDPFMGSGSTLIAAHQENRVAYGTEISAAYCDVVCTRWQNATGVKPERFIDDGTTESVDFTTGGDYGQGQA